MGLQNPFQSALGNPLSGGGLPNPFMNGGLQNPIFGNGMQSPFQSGLQGNPLAGNGFGNPFLNGVTNPAINALYAGQNPWQNGQFGQHGHQQHSPYSQLGQWGQGGVFGQMGYPLAPQSWVGQGGFPGNGQGFGQLQPLLQQIGARSFQNPGIGSWGQSSWGQ